MKRFFILCVVLIILLVPSSASVSAEKMTEQQDDILCEGEEDTYTVIMNDLGRRAEWGGCYAGKDGCFHIWSTNPGRTERLLARYDVDFPCQVDKANHSMSEMNRIKRKLSVMDGVNACSTDMMHNRITASVVKGTDVIAIRRKLDFKDIDFTFTDTTTDGWEAVIDC